jgi:hypothetical protein
MPEVPHRLDPAAPDLGRENRPEPIPPEPHRLMRDVDPPLVQKVLNVPQRKRVADIHHDRQADDLGRGLEVAENARVAHAARLAALPISRKPIFYLTLPSAVVISGVKAGSSHDALHPGAPAQKH